MNKQKGTTLARRIITLILSLVLLIGTLPTLVSADVAEFTLTFSITPAEASTAAEITLQKVSDGTIITPEAGGKTFSVDAGTYTYIIRAPLYLTQMGTIAVSESTVKNIAMQGASAASLTLNRMGDDHRNGTVNNPDGRDMEVEGSGYVGWIRPPCWIKFKNVNLLGGIQSASLNYARSGTGTNIFAICLAPSGSASPSGPTVSAVDATEICRASASTNTGGWGSPGTNVNMGTIAAHSGGVQDLYVYFVQGETNFGGVTLTLNPLPAGVQNYDVTFSVRPYNASVVVTKLDGGAVAPTTAGGKVYNLSEGFYRYSVSAAGYSTAGDIIMVDGAKRVTTVLLPEGTPAYTRYEAENATRLTNSNVMSNAGFSGGQGVNGGTSVALSSINSSFSNISGVRYTVTRPTTGIVEVILAYNSSVTAQNQDSVAVKCNDGTIKQVYLNPTGSDGRGYSSVFVDMMAGENTLYVSWALSPRVSNGGNAWIDHDYVDINSSTTPGSVEPGEADELYVQPVNPIVKAIFTADPEAHVWPTEPNKLYIYPSHDRYPSAGCDRMDQYHVYSTTNMVDFTDEGEILRRSDLPWITSTASSGGYERTFMWAPDAAYKDGWYYFYFPTPRETADWGATWETGVVRSRYPNKEFQQIPASAVDTNAGKPWLGYIRDSGAIDGYSNMYDVCVRVYDGEAYIYNGAAQTLWQGKLKSDMVTVEGGKMQLVSTDNQTVANNNGDPAAYRRLTNYHEGPSAFRRKDAQGNWKYYLIYPGGAGSYNGLSGDSFYYCVADAPLGPWGNAQIFFNPTGCGTSHGSIVEFNNKWYWVYHTQDLSNVGENRSVGIEEVFFNTDGTIQRFSKSSDGVSKNGPDYVKPSGLKLGPDAAVVTGTAVKSNDSSASNGGGVIYNIGPANTASVTYNNVDGGADGGRATLRFRYSTSDDLPVLNLKVNGIDYNHINFPKTGGRSFYSEIEFTVKRLNAGPTNTIVLTGYGSGGKINLNYMEVIPLDEETPAPTEDSFYSSFEASDPAIDPVTYSSSGLGYSITTTSVITSVSGEYTNYTGNPTITPSNYVNSTASEGLDKLIDQNTSTKLCLTGITGSVSDNASVVCPVSFTFQYTTPITPKAYYIAGANDDMSQTGRVLNTWVVEGSNDNSTWVELDSRGPIAWASNYQVQNFTVRSNPGSYTFIRLRVLRRGTGTGVTSGGIIQFSGFGMYSDCVVSGFDGTTNYEGLQISTGNGPAQLWGNTSSRANLGWTGSRALRIAGKKTAASGKSFTTIYDNLNVLVSPNTKLSYMVLPYIDADVQSNDYDAEYTSNYAAIDLRFNDGSYLSSYGALDQYGFKVSPLEQGNAGIIEQNNWLKVTSAIGAVPALQGKRIKAIIVGYEKPNGTPGKDVAVYFDDVNIYREDDPVITNIADYVNILRGTQNGAYTEDHNKYAHGLNNPIVATPFPFNFWSPSTTMSAQTVYQYSGSEANFKHIHLNHVASNWISESGNFDFSADSTTVYSTAAALATSLGARGSNFKHENEIAHAHYYGVTFNDNDAKAPGVKIEVTPTEHAAVLRFTFPVGSAQRNVILDSAKARSSSTSGITYNNDGTFAAFTSRANNGQKRMYVYGKFSVVPTAFRQASSANTPQSMFEFAAASEGPTVVELKVASSFISAAQAIKNLDLEISSADNFDSIKAKALALWNEKLSTVTVEDPNATYDQLSSLYSNLYRAFVYPLLDSENVGTNEAPDWQYASPYSGNSTTITLKSGRLFYNNGFWDTYRTAWPVYALLIPEKDSDLVNGLVQHYLDNGWVPRWIAPAGTNSMVGTNSDSIFGDAISQGIKFNYADAYASSLKNATVYSANSSANFYSGRAGMATWPFLGYSPTSSLTDENLSWSLESCPADFGIAQMAKALRDKELPGTEAYRKLNDEYVYFINRAQNFVTLFNPALGGWFRGKTVSGEWLWPDSQFNPVAFGYGYCEDNAWNYAFHAPQDGRGLANLYGGQAKLGEKLDALLNASPQVDFGNWSGWHKEKVESRGSKLGQLHMSNEPAFHIPYMYLYTDRPWKTAEVVRDILDRHFAGSDIGQGYIGDDDNGAMSSWYVISALGLYPLTGGNGEFVFGTPLFEKTVIKRDNGQTITITAPGVSRTNKYIQSVKVNGVARAEAYIKPADIRDGATIEFTVGSSPSATWGVGIDVQPPSLTADDEAPSPLRDLTTAVTPSTTVIPSGFADGAYTNATSPASLFNNTSADYASFASGSKFVYYYFSKGATVDMYTITSSTTATAPTEWILSGSLDGESWTTLDVRKNQSFAWERYTRPFAIDNPGRYKLYKLEFTNATEAIRVAQLELLGGRYALINKDILYEIILQGRSINSALYAEETYKPLAQALIFAETVYADANAQASEIADAINRIAVALEGLIRIKFAGVYFDGVECDLASSGVKKEATTNVTGALTGDVTNLGGLTPGSYVGFSYVDFGVGQFWWTKAKLMYAGKDADLRNSRVIVHLDALDGPVIADFGIAATGAEWNVYAEASGLLSQNDITGMHTVYYEFRGSGTSVANIHAFAFEYSSPPGVGSVIHNITDDSITSVYKYQNLSSETQNLTLHIGIYAADGKMKYTASGLPLSVDPLSIVDFEVVLNVPNFKAQCLENDYFIGIFLWDTLTYIPVVERYYEKALSSIAQQDIDAVKVAIEAAGAFQIPQSLNTQSEKTAWVQEQVDALIPAGNLTVATVTYDGGYTAQLVNGTLKERITIIIATPKITVTFMASEADTSYSVAVEADSFGTVSLPANPVRTGYRFLGWYFKSADGDWRFTADTVVTSNTIARAKWAVDPSDAHATLIFDNTTYSYNLTMLAYSSSGENGAQAATFRDDTVARIDSATNRYMYLQLPTTHALRDETNLVFDITYYDVGTSQFMLETANTTLTGTERDYGNRFWLTRSNSGELVTATIYVTNAGIRRGQNGSCDLRIQGQAQYVYIKSIVVRAGTQTPFDEITPPTFAPQTAVNNLIGKTVAGYQLWFTASDTNSGWVHWSRGQRPTTSAQITFENYPDVREYPAAALSNTGLPNLANGSISQLFTSKRSDVVDLHLSWMEQYGLDGVAIQRFSGEVVTSETPTRNHLNLVQDAAERTGKILYIMYDFSNCNNTTVVNNIKRDWVFSIEKKGIVSSPNYAHANGKPVVCLWGLSGVASQSDGNVYVSQANALDLISWFHNRGYFVIGGTPDNDWTQRTDSYSLVYQALDMISPWTPGRYGHTNENIVPWLEAHVDRELAYCAQYGIVYQPVMFPGFNWSSFQPYPPNEIPRAAGEMLWTQAKYLKNKGITTAYFAMYDEYDEGTAYIKCAEDSSMLPLGTTPYFQTLAADGRWLSSDFYLRLAGAVTGLLKSSDASISSSAPVPVPHSLGPVYWRNGFESRYQNANTRFAGGYVQVDVCLYKPAVVQSSGISDAAVAIVAENAHGGTAYSLNFKGTSASASSGYQYKIAETAILVPQNLQLSYWINAQNELGKSVYVDLQFSDGTLLSDSAGFVQKTAATTGAWEQITVDLGASYVGKTVTAVVVSYKNGAAGDFAANLDDMAIQIKP